MACPAVVAKPPLMNILMAIGAVGKLNPGKLLKWFPVSCFLPVATCACRLPVPASQGKTGSGMVKVWGGPEGILIVARSTYGG